MSKSDGVDVRELLEAIRRRGGYRRPVHPKIGQFETIRETARWLGQIYPQQLVTLKRNAMLISGSNRVVVQIDLDANPPLLGMMYAEGTRDIDEVQTMMEALVLRVLGPGWKVVCGKLGGNEPGPAEVKSPERAGEGSPPAAG